MTSKSSWINFQNKYETITLGSHYILLYFLGLDWNLGVNFLQSNLRVHYSKVKNLYKTSQFNKLSLCVHYIQLFFSSI